MICPNIHGRLLTLDNECQDLYFCLEPIREMNNLLILRSSVFGLWIRSILRMPPHGGIRHSLISPRLTQEKWYSLVSQWWIDTWTPLNFYLYSSFSIAAFWSSLGPTIFCFLRRMKISYLSREWWSLYEGSDFTLTNEILLNGYTFFETSLHLVNPFRRNNNNMHMNGRWSCEYSNLLSRCSAGSIDQEKEKNMAE